MHLGQAIRLLRLSKKLTQEHLALEAEIATSNVSRIENGLRHPSQKVLQKIAQALGSSPAMIYQMSQQEPQKSNYQQATDVLPTLIDKDDILLVSLFKELNPDNRVLALEQLKLLKRLQK